ncbi:myotubularin-related protein 9-like isoform X1 [Gopherus flavomarginatus]|uniref:myotubularin-related protein 9-like isoform X1 n=2 Tax=Gopherus flavomarginatus TaxID=286002 RepID=UPI0021CBFAC2|nr:myotubularin-related protein 9-like isoform X1 [Gopherus flavomarginatus]XP_050788385.1 myotubularin-related protein 9-like isoform X1 [Gopherus flavomarginatus]
MEFAELIKTAKVENVQLSCPGLPPIKGTLCITSHHLLLSSQPGGNGEQGTVELWLLIRNVDAVEKSVQNLGWYQTSRTNSSHRETRIASSLGTITLKCKDLKVLQLEIPGMEECLNIASSTEALSSVDSVMMMYPFFYRPQSMKLKDGWQLYPLQHYYQQIASETSAWRLSCINGDFTICSSYPPAVIVPATVDDKVLQKAARFRQGGRFPVLSYYHKKNGTVMLRSSQPLIGPNRKSCQEDELLLSAVLDGGERGFIIDTRSAQAAKQARMMGGGTEPKSSYPRWKRLHRPLERGRPLQESFIKLVEACNDTSLSMDRWLSKLEGSKWLAHVKAALSTACLAAQCMEREEACILVHGAEGTDTTLLVTALAQVILDPNCRTLTGFQGLLEREWIEAGHPFHFRCAHSAYSHARLKQEAPIFLLFLDCVWQLGRQFPFSLQFNERLLLVLFEHTYASCYGTFLCNSEKERCLCEVKEKTHSLWSRLNQPSELKKHLNPLYTYNALVIWPSVEPQSLQLWQGLFLRWIQSSQYLDEAWAEIQRLVTSCEDAPEERAGRTLCHSQPDAAYPLTITGTANEG